MRKAHIIMTAILLMCTIALTAQPFMFHGSTGGSGATLVSVDPFLGTATPIAPHGSFGPVTEIQFDPTGSLLYGTTGGGSGNFISIDPVSGIETLIGTYPGWGINGMEFVGSTLYGTHVSGVDGLSQLVIIDPLNAGLTFIGPTGHNQIGGLAYDNSTGIMYGITSLIGHNSELVRIDLNTGIATPVGFVGSWCHALAFGADGQLYTHSRGDVGGDKSPNGLLILDVNTAAPT